MYPLAFLALLIAVTAGLGVYFWYVYGERLAALGFAALFGVAGTVFVLAVLDLYEYPEKIGQRPNLPPHPCETGTCGGPSKNWPWKPEN